VIIFLTNIKIQGSNHYRNISMDCLGTRRGSLGICEAHFWNHRFKLRGWSRDHFKVDFTRFKPLHNTAELLHNVYVHTAAFT